MPDYFFDIQTSSPKEAADTLFNNALSFVPDQSVESIRSSFEGYKGPWGSTKLIKGNKTELYEIVLRNLEWTQKTAGFQYFTVHVRDQQKLAQVISWSDSKGASACVWRNKEELYLCGNVHFDYSLK